MNINCQSRDAIHDSLNLLFHWTLSKKAQNPEISGQQIATLLVTGLTGLANEWWRWLPQRVRDDILNSDDADQQLLKSLATQFHGGDDEDDADHLASLFMSTRLCNLSQVDEYFCYMQKLLIRAGKASDPAYLKHYLRSFPGHVPDAVEKYMKDKNLNYQNFSIAQLHHHIKETWQEHCMEKRIDKDFKRH